MLQLRPGAAKKIRKKKRKQRKSIYLFEETNLLSSLKKIRQNLSCKRGRHCGWSAQPFFLFPSLMGEFQLCSGPAILPLRAVGFPEILMVLPWAIQGFLHGRDHTRDLPFHLLCVAKSGCDVCDSHSVTVG